MKKQRRWMTAILAAANEPQVALPWTRGARRRPEAVKAAPKSFVKPAAMAAR